MGEEAVAAAGAGAAADGTSTGSVWSRLKGGGLTFQEIWTFEPDADLLNKMKTAERVKSLALANQVIGTGLDTHAYFGGQAEGEWTRDTKEYVLVAGSLLNAYAAWLDWLNGPDARKAAAKQQIVGIQQQALDFKPVRFDWDPKRTEDDFKANPRNCWVAVSQAQKDELEKRDGTVPESGWSSGQAGQDFLNALEEHYGTTAASMNQAIMAIVVAANGSDIRSSLALAKAALETLMTVKGQWDSEKTGDGTTPDPPAEPPGPAYLPPREGSPAPPPGGTPDPVTQLAGITAPPPGPVSTLGGGTAAALTPPALGPTGGLAGDARPGPIGGFMGAPPAGRVGDGRRAEDDRYARQWEVTEEDGEIWGTETITASDSGVLR